MKKNISFNETHFALILAVGGLLTWVYISLISEGETMGGDSYLHYKYARYSFQFPELLLHHWGKPVYTLLASPFAQFGYQGAKLFNVLLGTVAAWFTFLVARKLKFGFAPLAVILVLFTPYYTLMMVSAMTEVLFSLMVIVTIFLILDDKPVGAAVLVSFIPLVRSEGYAIILGMLVVFMINKHWRAVPFLLTGTLIYSLAGWFHFGDFWWIFTQSPYNPEGVEFYGTGDFFYYIKNSPDIFGWPLLYLIVVGTVVMTGSLLSEFIRIKAGRKATVTRFILVPGIFYGFLFMQSYMWYAGLFGVLGSMRFIASVIPLGALLALSVLQLIPAREASRNKIMYPVVIIIGVFIIVTTKYSARFPFPKKPRQYVIEEVVDYVNEHKLPDQKIWYTDPAFFVAFDLNPYDEMKSELMSISNLAHEFQILPGDYLIWDQQFSPNELSLPFERLAKSDQFTLLSTFYPPYAFKTLGNKDYRIVLFQRTEPGMDNPAFRVAWDSLSLHYNLQRDEVKVLKFLDYEATYQDKYKNNLVIEDDGNQVVKLDEFQYYYSLMGEPLGHATHMESTTFYLSAEAICAEQEIEDTQMQLIFSTQNDEGFTSYEVVDLTSQINKEGGRSWIYTSGTIDVAEHTEEETLKIYLWRVEGSDILLDNILLVSGPADEL